MILAVLQARTSSARLPGKVLKPILGKPMLAHQIERLKRSARIERLVVATSTESTDEAVASLAEGCGVDAYRGDLDDVLDRVYRAAANFGPSRVVRLTGDCPLADWQVIDRVIDFACQGEFDYASNTLKPTWPDGLDVEVVAFKTMETAWREAKAPLEREHVTPFIYNDAARFRLGNLENDVDLSGLRWTVDEPEDFEFATRVYAALYPENPAFTTPDILDFLSRNPDVAAVNADIERNAGLGPTPAPVPHGCHNG